MSSVVVVAVAVAIIIVASSGGSAGGGSKADQAFAKLSAVSRNAGERFDDACVKAALAGLSSAQLDVIIKLGWSGVFLRLDDADSARFSSCIPTGG